MDYSDETQVKKKNNQIRINSVEDNLKLLKGFFSLDNELKNSIHGKNSPTFQMIELLERQIKTLKFNL